MTTTPRVNSSFECVLPPEARRELLELPKLTRPLLARPRATVDRANRESAPGRRKPGKPAGWIVLALLTALVLASNVYFYRARPIATAVKPTPVSTPQNLPKAELTLPALRAELVRLPAPRAELVRMPAPRAELVKPHPPRALPVNGPGEVMIGEDKLLDLPSGLEALARYKGSLTNESEHPVSGNSIGDTWAVGSHLWLWLVEPGTSKTTWVDP